LWSPEERREIEAGRRAAYEAAKAYSWNHPSITAVEGNVALGALYSVPRDLPTPLAFFSMLVYDERGNVATPFNRPSQASADLAAYDQSALGRAVRVATLAYLYRDPSKINKALSIVGLLGEGADLLPEPEKRTYRGGPHSEMRKPTGDTLDSHHMPARTSLAMAGGSIGADAGPAIQMEHDDHTVTRSYGSSTEAYEYRAKIAEMLRNGEWRKAMAAEIREIRRVAGSKYNAAIREMLEYARSLRVLEKK